MARYMTFFLNVDSGEVDGVYKTELDNLKEEIGKVRLEELKSSGALPDPSAVKQIKCITTVYTKTNPTIIWFLSPAGWIAFYV